MAADAPQAFPAAADQAEDVIPQKAWLLSRQGKLPRHLAIIMDGNGRWAQRRDLPRRDFAA